LASHLQVIFADFKEQKPFNSPLLQRLLLFEIYRTQAKSERLPGDFISASSLTGTFPFTEL